MTQLITSSLKTQKGIEYGYLTGVCYLSPANDSGLFAEGSNGLCPFKSKGCGGSCLKDSGMLGFTASQQAQFNRTEMFVKHRAEFIRQFIRETAAVDRRARKLNLATAIRPNGTADIAWARIAPELFAQFPTINFYDYTKSESAMRWARSRDTFPRNYHLTYSVSEDSRPEFIAECLTAGQSVAVVYNHRFTYREALAILRNAPEFANAQHFVNGDIHDLRFTDKRASIVLLRAKGRAKKDTTGFVRLQALTAPKCVPSCKRCSVKHRAV